MPQYELTYFNGRGRGELIRLCLAFAGQEFEDKRIEGKDWPALKAELPVPYLPVLRVDGQTVQETCLIAQYVAQQHGFGGESEIEKVLISSLTFYIESVFTKAVENFFEKDEARKETMKKKFDEEVLPAALGNLEARVTKNSAGVLAGSSITQADIHFYNTIWTLKQAQPDLLSNSPGLAALYEKVSTDSKIAAWVAKRPETQF